MPRKLQPTTRKRATNYHPGDWFEVPIAHGHAYGLMARATLRGSCLGYFFLSSHPLTALELAQLRPEDAHHVERFGDLALIQGEWPVIGHMQPWDPAAWPMPVFRHQDATGGWWVLRSYDDQFNFTGEHAVSPEEAQHYPEDGTAGARYLQEQLARLALQKLVAPTNRKTRRPNVAAKRSQA